MEGKTLVDLGGGLGMVMEAVANKYPGIGRVISLDSPEVIKGAPKLANEKAREAAPRCNVAGLTRSQIFPQGLVVRTS